jgi:hypothetical protein
MLAASSREERSRYYPIQLRELARIMAALAIVAATVAPQFPPWPYTQA